MCYINVHFALLYFSLYDARGASGKASVPSTLGIPILKPGDHRKCNCCIGDMLLLCCWQLISTVQFTVLVHSHI